MLKHIVVATIAATCLLGCSDDEAASSQSKPQMSFSVPAGNSWSASEMEQVKLALEKLNRQCAPLAAYWADVTNAEASLRDTVSDHLKEKGWARNVYAQVKFKPQLKETPRSYNIQGHTCHFDIGIEGDIGLSVAKVPCQKICAMNEEQMAVNYVTFGQLVMLQDAPEEKNIRRIKEIEKQFSAWDGSHRNLERLVKQNLNDPSSYEHDKTLYWDKNDYLIVSMNYRAKNAFGALVKGYVKAKTSLNGEVLEIVDSY